MMMRPKTLTWIGKVEGHIAQHEVNKDEVEQIFQGDSLILKGRGQNLYLALGRTHSGRLLTVAYVVKRDRTGFVLTAREMALKERRLYRKKGGK